MQRISAIDVSVVVKNMHQMAQICHQLAVTIGSIGNFTLQITLPH